jgi:hypothetical protein
MTVHELLFEKKSLVLALQQLIAVDLTPCHPFVTLFPTTP